MAQETGAFSDAVIDEHAEELWATALDIYEHPELAFEEVHTSQLIRDALVAAGFTIEQTWDDLPTGFVASYSRGTGPCVGVVSELDALPGLGHACGHHLIATSGLATALATARTMDEFGIDGTVKLFATPAEEDGGGKIIMLEKGAWDGTDAVLLMHPTSAMTRIGGECCSCSSLYVSFTGRSAQAESHPENGINAMDAATLFHAAIGMNRQQLPSDLHIANVVTKMSDDIISIPERAELETEVTTLVPPHLELAEGVITRIAEGVAHATGCELELRIERGYLGRIPNTTISEVLRGELERVGEPVMEGMPIDLGSEDLGNVSQVIPAVNLFGTILPERKISGHTPEFREIAGTEAGKHCLLVTSKAMARTLVDLLQAPELLEEAKAELAGRMEELARA